ncbi:MAG: hypothetical protein HC849_21720 [Oscillatoriales cyanobacterium RU_3_3]|nr:hypothetical protein [Oscillatoriales cyanobacterium RU_3_3]
MTNNEFRKKLDKIEANLCKVRGNLLLFKRWLAIFDRRENVPELEARSNI